MGGETLLMDGFKVAEVLREEHPDSFRFLSSFPVEAGYIHAGEAGRQRDFTVADTAFRRHPISGELEQFRSVVLPHLAEIFAKKKGLNFKSLWWFCVNACRAQVQRVRPRLPPDDRRRAEAVLPALPPPRQPRGEEGGAQGKVQTDQLLHTLCIFKLFCWRNRARRIGLEPGWVLIVNNWRVLHGRTAFSGERSVVGCYISRTDFLSAAGVLGMA